MDTGKKSTKPAASAAAPAPLPATALALTKKPDPGRRLWLIAGVVVGLSVVVVVGAALSRMGKAPARQTFTSEEEKSAGGSSASVVVTPLPAPPPEPAADIPAMVARAATLSTAMAASPQVEDAAVRREIRLGRPAGKGEASAAAAEALKVHNWELQIAKGNTLETYAKMLDFFGIELGALMPEGKIIYAYNLSKLKPDTRVGPAASEKRYYFTWARGDLRKADQDLYSQAGVDTSERVIVCFMPREIEALIADLEKSYAGEKAGSVAKTRVGLRRKADGYEFFVVEQAYK